MERLSIVFIFVLLAFNCDPIKGQIKLNSQQQEQIQHKINAATASMKVMQCDFVQTKKMKLLKKDMVSNGIMYYSSPDKLRWQYTKPYEYIFVLNGDRVSIKSSKSTQEINVNENKMFRQLSNIILNSVTGGHLKSSVDFDVEIWKNNTIYTATLHPKKKELKKLYKSIEISFNASLTMVETVKMEEITGDITIVNLKNVKINRLVREDIFSIN